MATIGERRGAAAAVPFGALRNHRHTNSDGFIFFSVVGAVSAVALAGATTWAVGLSAFGGCGACQVIGYFLERCATCCQWFVYALSINFG